MADFTPEDRTRLLQFLQQRIPQPLLLAAISSAERGDVLESYRSEQRIHGMVKGSDNAAQRVSLFLTGTGSVEPSCSCGESDDSWCKHAVALLWVAGDLGFLNRNSGFVAEEARFRGGSVSARDVATVVSELKNLRNLQQPVNAFHPKVKILLDLRGDKLGVRITFDKEVQVPVAVKDLRVPSARALDNILLQLLDDEGIWDDELKFWYVSSSASLEKLLGLIREYRNEASILCLMQGKDGPRSIEFADELLSAKLIMEWEESSVELSVYWALPDGTLQLKESDLLGTGPFWTAVSGHLYRVTPEAARICSLFSYGSTITFSKPQSGPILEALSEGFFKSDLIEIKNPQHQPQTEVTRPDISLDIRAGIDSNSVDTIKSITLTATLEFQYPEAKANKNLVYLPNRELEDEAVNHLRSLGFELDASKKRFIAQGDNALDIISKPASQFPKQWKIIGFDEAKRSVKFAKLELSVAVSKASDGESRKAKPSESESQKIEWFDTKITLTQNTANIPISSLFKNSAQYSDRWVRLDSGAFARVPGGGLGSLRALLGSLDPSYRISNAIKTKMSAAQALAVSSAEDETLSLSMDNSFQKLVEKFRDFHKIEPVPLSKKFVGELRPYQSEGLSWINFLEEFGFGGILADEMGLGKTVQTLAFLQHLKDRGEKGPSLIVVPTSLLANWAHESARFTPALRVLVLHGPERKSWFEDLKRYDIVITSYALLRLDRKPLEKTKFNFIILDEAQNIKNFQAATTKAAKGLQSRRRLALSGTPTENRPMELWSIMDFLMPGYLGSSEAFQRNIEKPILEHGPGVQVASFLRRRITPFILRRTKAEVEKDLPPKIESSLFVEMTESQKSLYLDILNEVRPRVLEAVEEKGVRGASVSILAALLRLRQVCNHPNSIDAFKSLEGFDSGKFNLLKEVLSEALESGRKIIIYSQFLEMLNIVRRWVEENSHKYVYLDGSTKNRQDVVNQFNHDESVRLFLVSLKAGGTGLNLTAADTVIIYDPWWNPAVEDQAADRAHRIGQTKTVNVYRLITEDSVESKIMQLKEKKTKIVDALLNTGKVSPLNLSKKDIESLFAPVDLETNS